MSVEALAGIEVSAPAPSPVQGRPRPQPWVTVETEIDPTTTAAFHDLYLAAFGPLRTRAVARQVLHRNEFFAEMSDPRVEKWVAWDDSGTPVGMTTLTRHLETVPWISPDYFAARFPDYAAREAVYYLGFTLVHPAARRDRVFAAMLDAIIARLTRQDAVLAYDVCAYNDDVLRMGRRMELILRRAADLVVGPLDTQTYYYVTHKHEAPAVPRP
jgi:hypothetical protein